MNLSRVFKNISLVLKIQLFCPRERERERIIFIRYSILYMSSEASHNFFENRVEKNCQVQFVLLHRSSI